MANTLLDAVDDFMLDTAQRISDAVDGITGISHWTIARGLLGVGMGLCILSAVVDLAIGHHSLLDIALSAFIAVVWINVYNMMNRKLTEQRNSRDAGRALRVSERYARTVDLLIMTLIVVLQYPWAEPRSMIFSVGLVLFHLHYYFKACDMPPPRASGKLSWSA